MYFAGAPPKKSSSKNLMSAGNLGMQKFEARKFMERFYRALTAPQATSETTDWKSKARRKYIDLAKLSSKRNSGRQRMKERIQVQENKELAHMIYQLKTENRKEVTREAGPGWRVGSMGGTVIDCYETENPLARRYAELHGYEKKYEKRRKEILRDNAKLKDDISKLRSDLSATAMKKAYEENRYRARFFFNKGQETELHLGLLDEFKQRDAKSIPSDASFASNQLRPRSAQSGTTGQRMKVFVNKPWNDDMNLGLPTSKLHINPDWNFEPLKVDFSRYRPLYADSLSLEKAALSYSPLHSARAPLSFYSDMRELAGGGARVEWRPSSAGHYGRAGSVSNQLKVARQGRRPASAGAVFRPQELRPLEPGQRISVGEIAPKAAALQSERARWMDQLPPFARAGDASKGKVVKLREESRMPLVPPRAGLSAAAVSEGRATEAHVGFVVAASAAVSDPSLQAQKRKLCLLESSIAVVSDAGAVSMRMSISDCGVVARIAQAEEGAEQGVVPLSSGVLVEVTSEINDSLSGQLFLSVKRLRELCNVGNLEGNLFAELLALRSRDKKAGLYDCIAEHLTSSSELALCEMLLREIKAQVNRKNQVMVWL